MTALSMATALVVATAQWPSLSPAPERIGGGESDAALIIGIEEYSHLTAVPGARQTAEDWYSYLTQTIGVPLEHVTVLVNQKATVERIRKFASEAAARTKNGGRLWLIFIGHGAPSSNRGGVLVGYDAQQDADSLYARSVPQSELIDIARRGHHERTVAVMDTCFSGRTASGAALIPGLQPAIALTAHPQPRATIMSAAGADEFAGPLPGLGRPAFSYLLLGALQGWGDVDGDGRVTASEAIAYAKSVLRTVVKDRTQTPELLGDGSETLVRARRSSPPDLTKVVLSEVQTSLRDDVRVPMVTVQKRNGTRTIHLEAERLLERALDAQGSEVLSSTEKQNAWCNLSELKEFNPYAAEAQSACGMWKQYHTRLDALRLAVDRDLSTVSGFIKLKHKTWEQKVGALAEFLRTYGALAPDARVSAAAGAMAELIFETAEPRAFYVLPRTPLEVPALPSTVARPVRLKVRASAEVARLSKAQEKALDALDQRNRHLLDEDAEPAESTTDEARRYEHERNALKSRFESQIEARETAARRHRREALPLLQKFIETHGQRPTSKLAEVLFAYAELAYEEADDDHVAAMRVYEEDVRRSTARTELPRRPLPDFRRALDALEQLIARFPTSGLHDDALYLAGYCHERMQNHGAAVRLFLQLPVASPFRIEASMRTGDILFGTGDAQSLRRAQDEYARAASDEKHPVFEKALYKLGWTCRRNGNRDCAILAFDRLTAFYRKRGVPGGDFEAEAVHGALALRQLDNALVAAAYQALLESNSRSPRASGATPAALDLP